MANKYRYVKESIERRRLFINKLKDQPCKRCGVKYPPYVMDWHHRDPLTKKFSIGSGAYRQSQKALLLEIGKCDLLCANCHRIVEYENNPFYK